MDKFFVDKENEIIDKLIDKPCEDIANFLGIEINNITVSVINQFKLNLKDIKNNVVNELFGKGVEIIQLDITKRTIINPFEIKMEN